MILGIQWTVKKDTEKKKSAGCKGRGRKQEDESLVSATHNREDYALTSHIRASAQLMRGFLKPLVQVPEVAVLQEVNENEGQPLDDDDFRSLSPTSPNPAIDLEFTVYVSDIDFEDDDIEEEEGTEEELESEGPQRKRRRMLEVPA